MFLTRETRVAVRRCATRAVTPFVGATLCIALLGGSPSPATAYQFVSTGDPSEYAFAADEDPSAVATLDVPALQHDEPADSAGAQPSNAVHTCVEPYDRPELACALASEATTFGSINSETGMNVYRFEAALPGTTMRAELIEHAAGHDVYVVGPGDVVLASAVGDGVSSKAVMAAVWTPGTHAIYVVARSQAQRSRYAMTFAAVAPVASTAIPLLPGLSFGPGDALAALPEQCPQANAVHDDTLLATALQMFALPCRECDRVDAGAEAEARIDDVPTLPKEAAKPAKELPTPPKQDEAVTPQKSGGQKFPSTVQDHSEATTSSGATTPSSDVKPSSPPNSQPPAPSSSVTAPSTSVTSPPAGQQDAPQRSAASAASAAAPAGGSPAQVQSKRVDSQPHANRVEPKDVDVPAIVPSTRANSSAVAPARGTGAQFPGAETQPSC